MKELVVYCPDNRMIVIRGLQEIWIDRHWSTKWALRFEDVNRYSELITTSRSKEDLKEALTKISEAYAKGNPSVHI